VLLHGWSVEKDDQCRGIVERTGESVDDHGNAGDRVRASDQDDCGEYDKQSANRHASGCRF
jgi:hypothetical protein